MGHEYQIRFGQNPHDFDSAVRRLRYFSEYYPKCQLYAFRDPSAASDSMPDAYVALDAEGLYFNETGRSDVAAVVFRQIVDLALETNTKVEIEEL